MTSERRGKPTGAARTRAKACVEAEQSHDNEQTRATENQQVAAHEPQAGHQSEEECRVTKRLRNVSIICNAATLPDLEEHLLRTNLVGSYDRPYLSAALQGGNSRYDHILRAVSAGVRNSNGPRQTRSGKCYPMAPPPVPRRVVSAAPQSSHASIHEASMAAGEATSIVLCSSHATSLPHNTGSLTPDHERPTSSARSVAFPNTPRRLKSQYSSIINASAGSPHDVKLMNHNMARRGVKAPPQYARDRETPDAQPSLPVESSKDSSHRDSIPNIITRSDSNWPERPSFLSSLPGSDFSTTRPDSNWPQRPSFLSGLSGSDLSTTRSASNWPQRPAFLASLTGSGLSTTRSDSDWPQRPSFLGSLPDSELAYREPSECHDDDDHRTVRSDDYAPFARPDRSRSVPSGFSDEDIRRWLNTTGSDTESDHRSSAGSDYGADPMSPAPSLTTSGSRIAASRNRSTIPDLLQDHGMENIEVAIPADSFTTVTDGDVSFGQIHATPVFMTQHAGNQSIDGTHPYDGAMAFQSMLAVNEHGEILFALGANRAPNGSQTQHH